MQTHRSVDIPCAGELVRLVDEVVESIGRGDGSWGQRLERAGQDLLSPRPKRNFAKGDEGCGGYGRSGDDGSCG